MMQRYTVERQGSRWVASNGKDAVEGDSPDDALDGLLAGEIDREAGAGDFDTGVSGLRKGDIADRVGECCLRIVRFLAIGAPEEIVAREADLLRSLIDNWAAS